MLMSRFEDRRWKVDLEAVYGPGDESGRPRMAAVNLGTFFCREQRDKSGMTARAGRSIATSPISPGRRSSTRGRGRSSRRRRSEEKDKYECDPFGCFSMRLR